MGEKNARGSCKPLCFDLDQDFDHLQVWKC